MEVVSRDALRKALQLIREVQKSGILLLIVRHVMQNPAWKPMVRTHRERIVEPYLAKLKAEAETTRQEGGPRQAQREAGGAGPRGVRFRRGGEALQLLGELEPRVRPEDARRLPLRRRP